MIIYYLLYFLSPCESKPHSKFRNLRRFRIPSTAPSSGGRNPCARWAFQGPLRPLRSITSRGEGPGYLSLVPGLVPLLPLSFSPMTPINLTPFLPLFSLLILGLSTVSRCNFHNFISLRLGIVEWLPKHLLFVEGLLKLRLMCLGDQKETYNIAFVLVHNLYC